MHNINRKRTKPHDHLTCCRKNCLIKSKIPFWYKNKPKKKLNKEGIEENFSMWWDFPGGWNYSLPAVQETWVWFLGQEDPLKKGMATHSRILAWRISWTEEPGGLQSMRSQRVGHDWATNIFTLTEARKPFLCIFIGSTSLGAMLELAQILTQWFHLCL